MTEFTPISALIGGGLIGLSALLLMLLLGRVAGCSGIITGALSFNKSEHAERPWRISFILGLIIGPLLAAGVSDFTLPQTSSLTVPITIIAALLVGFGAALGNGCTSGHGICGMGRLSKRSIVGTCAFMLSAFATVFVVNHVFTV